jgi:hypothetical protein
MGSLSLILGLATLCLGFHLGWGIYSLAISGIPSAFLCPLITFFFCKNNGFYPSTKSAWQLPTLSDIQRVFVFGKDAALISLGSQMVNASQIMIISRFVGLDSAATFSVGTKLYSLGQQLVAKVIGTAAPALTELFVRGEASKFRSRFFDVVSITVFLATMFASVLVLANRLVITIWTSGIIGWNLWSDVLLGALLIATGFTRCLIEVFVIRGNLKPVRYIYFFEGLISITLAIPVVLMCGITGLLAVALLFHFAVTLCLSLRAVNKVLFYSISLATLVLKSFLILAALLFLSLYFNGQHPAFIFPIISTLSLVCIGWALSWLFLLSSSLQAEVVNRLSFLKYKCLF